MLLSDQFIHAHAGHFHQWNYKCTECESAENKLFESFMNY